MPRSDDPTNSRGGHSNNRQAYPGPSESVRRPERPDYRQPQPPREAQAPRGAYDQYRQPEPPRRPVPTEPVHNQAYPPRAESYQPAAPRPAPQPSREDIWRDHEQRQSEAAIAEAIETRQKPQPYISDQFHQPTARPYDAEAERAVREAAYQPSHSNDLYEDPRQHYGAGEYQPGYDPRQDMRDDYAPAKRERAEQYPAATNVAPLFLPGNGLQAAHSSDLMQEHEDYFHHEEPVAPRASNGRAPQPMPAPDRQYGGAPVSLDMDGFDDYPLGTGVAPSSLAPTARGGHEEDSLDADFFDDEDFDPATELKQKKRGGKGLMAAMFVGALVIGGGGAYYYTMEGGLAETGLPTLLADAGQVKETPENPGGREFPNQTKKIYERLDTGEGATGGEEAAPQDSAAITTASTSPEAAPESGSLDDRIERALRQARKPGEGEPAGASAGGGRAPSLDDPRPVRTYTYGPDGSQLPAPRVSSDNSIVVTGADLGVAPQPAPSPVRPFETQQQPVRAAAAQPAPRPAQPAPAPRPQIVANAQTATAVAAPAGAYFLQLKASNNQAKAQSELADMQQKYASVLGSYGLNIMSVDLGDKGVWFRIRAVGFESKETAADMCGKLKSAGLKDCLIRAESQG